MGRFEIAMFRGLRLRKLAISFLRFPFLAKHDSLGASEENDATEEARDDEIRRSVPSPAGPDINLKHELAQLVGQIDWDFIDGEIAPLYSDKGRPGDPDAVCDRAVAAQAHLRAVRRRRV
jgi:hypothetical protein